MSNNKKKVLLINNPCSGKSSKKPSTEAIIERFSDDEYEFSVHDTTGPGDATNIVKRELEDNDLVICCGGDGTLNETINGVMDMPRRVPVGYIPAGTTNDLASTLGIPKDLEKSTDLIKSGTTNDYDLGLFNNRYFSYVASFGAFSGSSYTTSQKLKNLLGHSAYVLKGLTMIKDIHSTKMRIEYDDGVFEDRFIFGTVSNSTSVGGFFKFKKEDVKLNDGYFEVLLVKHLPFIKYVPAIRKVQKQHYDGKEIIFFRTKKIKITSPDEAVDWTIDGEYGGAHKKVMIHVLDRAIDICSPENPLFIKHEPIVIDPVENAKNKLDIPEKGDKKFYLRRNKGAQKEDGSVIENSEDETVKA